MFKVLDLFSGIGGFSLGLERTGGFETVAFCEIEDYPRRVLAKHWPEVPCYDDVRELTGERLAADGIAVDVICGGYPCQPFSAAGKRQGERDDRHLWPEVARLISELRPHWGIFENVAGHISMGLDQVLFDLEGLGYSWEAFVIPACSVNAPHRRDRVWIVTHPDSTNGWHKREAELQGHGARDMRETQPENDGDFVPLANPNIQGLQGGAARGEIQGRETATGHCGPSNGKDRGAWASEPGVCGVANGIPDRSHRLKALGNAVVPQIPEIIGRAILAVDGAT